MKLAQVVGNVVATARVVVAVYGILTVLAFAAFVAAGMNAFDGLLHALATISTGGFSPRAESIGAYDSELVAGAEEAGDFGNDIVRLFLVAYR